MPGLSPPRFTYRPAPATQAKLFTGSESGAAVDGASRTLSANTCPGLHVTLAASHVVPADATQSAGLAKSSAPSTTTGFPGDPCAWSTIGLPATPEAGTVTCSR